MTIAPFLFHRYPLDGERQVKIDGLRDDNILADMNAARDFLGAMEDVDNDRIGVLGH
jgi:dienelactone hydrolase